VVVVNGLGETLSSLDPETGELVVHAATLGAWPNRVRATPDGRSLLVTASGDNAVDVFDTSTLALRRRIALGPGRNPWVALPVSSTRAIVSNWLSGTIRSVSIYLGESEPPLDSSAPGPEGMAVSAGRAFVACTNYRGDTGSYGPGVVDVVDLTTWSQVASIGVGTNPQEVVVAPDGRLHIVCTGDYGTGTPPQAGEIHVVDPVTLGVAGVIPLGGSPADIAIDADGTAWVAGFADGLRRYDAVTLTLLPPPPDPILATPGFSSVAADTATGHLYAVHFDLDVLVEVHAATGLVTGQWLVGDGPLDVEVTRPPGN
jgi:DNA-binding beta-propeller fold protein YncE